MRSPTLPGLLREAATATRIYTPEGVARQTEILSLLSTRPLGTPKHVRAYHDLLLFVEAYAATPALRDLAIAELQRVVQHVAVRSRGRTVAEFENSGIAGSCIRSTFSLGLNTWLVHHFGPQVELFAEGLEEERVVQTLNHVLDPVEYEMLHSGKTTWSHWSTVMVGQGADRHRIKKWIVDMADRIPGSTALREYVFSQFALQTQWKTAIDVPSMSVGRAAVQAPYIHTDGLVKHATVLEAFSNKPPKQITLTPSERARLSDLAKGVLSLQLRETDPVTHANLNETLYFEMGRGMTIGLFAMKPDMKMTLQSYIGYMVFKNGVPCAYGGGWVLNDDSGFGVNIFPPFRGGESALLVVQLLRLYRHVYRVETFNVDPYQIGYGNPDGIASGAFWFYYRLGFRPVERDFLALANSEARAMKQDRTYRSPASTLKVLAESTMRWTMPGITRRAPITADAIGDVVTHHVNQHFQGDRQLAQHHAMKQIRDRIGRHIAVKHPIARIAVLLQACGYLETASKSELQRFMLDYVMKTEHEHEYIRASQSHPLLFRCLLQAERALHGH